MRPELTLLLDAPVEIGLARAGERGELDRFEREEIAFFQRVRECYLLRAELEPDRFRVIDTDRPLDQIARELGLVLDGLEVPTGGN